MHKVIQDAVYDKLSGISGLNTLMKGGIYNQQAPQEVTTPYLVYAITEDKLDPKANKWFRSSGVNNQDYSTFLVQISLFDRKISGLAAINSGADLVFYGLENKGLTASGYDRAFFDCINRGIVLQGGLVAQDEHYVQLAQAFRLKASRNL